MKILVIGAGVIGSLYAGKLAQNSHQVTVLARGPRLEELRREGVVLLNDRTQEKSVVRVDLTDYLGPEDAYDLVLVMVRKNQVSGLLPMLAANNATPNVLFMTNNAAGPFEMIRALGRERVIFGFPGAGGIKEGETVRYHLVDRRVQMTTVGEYTGVFSPRIKKIAALFEQAGFPTRITGHIDAWLKTHVALVSPLANAVSLAGGSTRSLAHTPDGLVLLVRAIREGFSVLSAMGQPITPFYFGLLGSLPEPVVAYVFSRFLDSDEAELTISSHANTARDEMKYLYEEFLWLARTTSVSTRSIETLGSYLEEGAISLPKGSRKITPHWEEVFYLASGFVAAMGFFRLLRRFRR